MLVILGPTAVGKSAVAMEVARRREGEIVSCDSMQVYRGMDVGTAKPSAGEREEIPHHLMDIVEPEEKYDAARFLRDAEAAIETILSKEKFPILVGGTPMYLKAFLFGLFDGPPADMELREKLKLEAEEKGAPALWERLKEIDPKACEKIHPNDLRRIVRAFEVYEKTGRPISGLQEQWERDRPQRQAVLVGLSRPRDVIHERIDERMDEMFARGLVDEVKLLRPRLGPTARMALGYQEVLKYLDGGCTLEEAVQAAKNNTHKFVRRQMTWYRSLKDIKWLDISDGDSPSETSVRALEVYDEQRT